MPESGLSYMNLFQNVYKNTLPAAGHEPCFLTLQLIHEFPQINTIYNNLKSVIKLNLNISLRRPNQQQII